MIRAFPWARLLLGAALAGALGLGIAAFGAHIIYWWGLGVVVAVLAAAVAAGVFWMSSGLFARPLLGVRPQLGGAQLALTFDDGPDPEETRRVLDLLEARGHRATFFVIGARAAAHPDLLAEMVRRGHALGNHSYAHAWNTALLPVGRVAADLSRAQAVLARAAGSLPRWFRPPAGVLSPRVVAAARQLGLELVGWTASARDGISTSIERAASRLLRAAHPGAILVLHDAVEHTGAARRPIAAQVLERLLAALDDRGLTSVTLDTLLGSAKLR